MDLWIQVQGDISEDVLSLSTDNNRLPLLTSNTIGNLIKITSLFSPPFSDMSHLKI
jgi:hypothetical protein